MATQTLTSSIDVRLQGTIGGHEDGSMQRMVSIDLVCSKIHCNECVLYPVGVAYHFVYLQEEEDVKRSGTFFEHV